MKVELFMCVGPENTATRGAFEKTAGRSFARGMQHKLFFIVTPQSNQTKGL